MGYVVLHLEKTNGTDSAMSAHIERTIAPKNADAKRTHLNRELVKFPKGVRNRTEAIQYRLDNAGLQRKIGKNQVRAIRILLSGSQEDMKQIEADGKLEEWCNDNLNWLKQTYGDENIVSAVLHLDETTPHIHATLVPIVTTERRKKKSEMQVKKQYRKKGSDVARLSADDVMARTKLKEYQNTYAKAMSKHGLQRGIEGSVARHISTSQYYRELYTQKEDLKEDIGELLQKQIKAQKELSKAKSEMSKEKLINATAEVGANLINSVNTLLGNSKVKQQQKEINSLKEKNHSLTNQLQDLQKEYVTTNEKLRGELEKIYETFPKLQELLSMERFFRALGFSEELTKQLLREEKVGFKGKLYSNQHRQYFETNHSVAKIERKADKLYLSVDGMNITDWFKSKYSESKNNEKIDIIERNLDKGRKM
ncbi:mobilization protein [Capnocytophaga cynodegmi]|uniref:MobV family relaxase n=1 Tax=Capnocytophaga cynodegmi TaxID=28189 RepID=UPI001EE1D118|nr:MobV family relaxase [Capnocytophaga cynodegmi]GJQ07823.1 mobilization protein [Capnocytophaga cynodegmi]